MSPLIAIILLLAVAGGFLIYKNKAHARSVSTRFALELADALILGYIGYVAINLLLNFSAFSSWSRTASVLFLIPPMNSAQLLAGIGGVVLTLARFKQGPGTDYKDKRSQVGGRRVLCHRAALLVADAFLAKRTADSNDKGAKLKRPQHMGESAHYDLPDDEELEKIVPLEDPETNPALIPYVAESDEFATVAWGGIRLPMEEARKHCLVVGGTGSGKTLLIHALMKSVLPRIHRPGDFRAFVYDDKLDFLPFARQMGIEPFVWNLDPYAEGGVAWDIAADVNSQEAARQVAEALAPVDRHQTQKYFDRAAQQLLAAAMIRLRERCEDKWTLRDLLLACINRKRLEMFLEGSSDVWVVEATSNLLSPRDSTADVMGTLSEKLMPYAPVAALWTQATKKVSIKEWHRSNAILLLVMRQGCAVALKPINQALFRLASAHLVDDVRTDRESWIFLDEAREIGKLEGLTALTNKGRDKGVRVVIGFQTIEGLQTAWGSKEAGNEAANICSNRVFLHSDSVETCNWMAKHVGAIEVDETVFQQSHSKSKGGSSTGMSWQTQRQTRSSMHASDFDDNFKPATPEFGVTALNIIPLIGTYVSWLPWSWVTEHLPKASQDSEKMRAPELQELRPWDPDERSRFGLTEKAPESDQKAESEGEKSKPPSAGVNEEQKKEKSRRLWNTRLDR